MDRAFAIGIAARKSLINGDTAKAIVLLSQLRPSATRPDVAGGLWEGMAGEDILLARLLLSQRRYRDAHRVAERFDRPFSIMYLLYLGTSLEIRDEAERALGWREVSRRRLQEVRKYGST